LLLIAALLIVIQWEVVPSLNAELIGFGTGLNDAVKFMQIDLAKYTTAGLVALLLGFYLYFEITHQVYRNQNLSSIYYFDVAHVCADQSCKAVICTIKRKRLNRANEFDE